MLMKLGIDKSKTVSRNLNILQYDRDKLDFGTLKIVSTDLEKLSDTVGKERWINNLI